MKIEWLGHSCFRFTSAAGTRLLTDPFDQQAGYALPSAEADIVTVSHGHFDHAYVETVKGNFSVVDKPGLHKVKGIDIKGIPAFHDEKRGAKRGPDIIFKFVIDDIAVCHCGDLGHLLTDEQVGEIGHADFLFLPVGGTYTIDAPAAVKVIQQLKPSVTVPMHYKTEACGFPIDGVDRFLSLAGSYLKTGKTSLEVDKAGITALKPVMVFEYK